MNGGAPNARRWRRLALAAGWLAAGAIAFVTLCPIGLRPQTGHPNAERFAAFFLAGACLGFGYPRHRVGAALGVTAAAIALEAAQLLAPGRDAHVRDCLVKMAGGLCGVALAALADRSVRA